MSGWQNIRNLLHRKATVPAQTPIPPGRVRLRDALDSRPTEVTKDTDYFSVRINQLFLAESGSWFREYDPMVFTVCEFIYGTGTQEVPSVVGPTLLGHPDKTPEGMVFQNTRVAGLHPFRGGRLNLSVVLCRVKRTDYAQALLGVLEKTAGAIDVGSAFLPYSKLAGALFHGVESLLELQDTEPLIGLRTEFDLDVDRVVPAGYYTVIDNATIDTEQLWVINDELHIGPDRDHLSAYRASDFILYSVNSSISRTDVSTLPFYDLYTQAKKAAGTPEPEGWERAKALMLALYQAMLDSHDLTRSQADELADLYIADLQRIHEIVKTMLPSQLGEVTKPEERDALTKATNRILKLA